MKPTDIVDFSHKLPFGSIWDVDFPLLASCQLVLRLIALSVGKATRFQPFLEDGLGCVVIFGRNVVTFCDCCAYKNLVLVLGIHKEHVVLLCSSLCFSRWDPFK